MIEDRISSWSSDLRNGYVLAAASVSICTFLRSSALLSKEKTFLVLGDYGGDGGGGGNPSLAVLFFFDFLSSTSEEIRSWALLAAKLSTFFLEKNRSSSGIASSNRLHRLIVEDFS